jgi:hypothetical protein
MFPKEQQKLILEIIIHGLLNILSQHSSVGLSYTLQKIGILLWNGNRDMHCDLLLELKLLFFN